MAVAVLVMLAGPPAADACACVVSPLCESMWLDGRCPAYFLATVDALEPTPGGMILARLRDVAGVHGVDGPAVLTSRFDDSCGYAFTVGERYLIDATPRADGTLVTSICSKTALVENAGETLAYLESLSKPPAGGRIFGEVFSEWPPGGLFDDADRRPVADLRLHLTGPVVRTTVTDREGRYSFDGLPAGQYVLQGESVPGMRPSGEPPGPILLPNARACSDHPLFYQRPRP